MPPLSSSYQEALAWLYGTQRFGIKLGLDNVRRLFAASELPDTTGRILHVAGTNGKGSVCAMLDSICRAQGYRTGLFTSPHLVTFRERIQVDGQLIAESEVAEGLTTIRELTADFEPHPTFFEIITALALRHFSRSRCEIIVLETGMGGRLDATNATQPIVSIITPIDYDHQAWLGNTLAEIAAEKAGIIKPNTPVVSSSQPEEAAAVLRARAAECNAPLQFVTEPYRKAVALPGQHQNENAALAVAALEAAGVAVNTSTIERGLASVRWPARFQRWDERIVIDGAHNPASARTLAAAWREIFGNRGATVILAVLRDKDVSEICRALKPITRRLILPKIRSQRALSPGELAEIVFGTLPTLPCSIVPSVIDAISSARAEVDPILITGSLHFAGEALAALQGVPAAYEECAQ